MTNDHPITPPPELVREWNDAAIATDFRPYGYSEYIATQAAQWGADQELEACIDWISVYPGLEHPELLIELLRPARRSKPPSLKEQALAILEDVAVYELHGGATTDNRLFAEDMSTIRRALEQLPDHE